jgi:uncharacterized protein (DUF58 family)
VSQGGLAFPLVPRRRVIGLAFGAMHSARRGMGSDVAGSRPYLAGDDVDTIDWGASAKLSSARGADEFIVREHYADEAPRVLLICDRRPEMALCPPGFPWLRKSEAMSLAAEIITESASKARGFLGYLDFATGEEEPFWRPPTSHSEHWAIRERHLAFPDYEAPPDTIERSLAFLADHRRAAPAGTFLFVISDFLAPPPREAWARALEQRWDVVPVVIQDPVWEQSFPELPPVVVPYADSRTGRIVDVRLSTAQARERRVAHERRLSELLTGLVQFGLEPVLVGSSEPREIDSLFLAWAERRRRSRRRVR